MDNTDEDEGINFIVELIDDIREGDERHYDMVESIDNIGEGVGDIVAELSLLSKVVMTLTETDSIKLTAKQQGVEIDRIRYLGFGSCNHSLCYQLKVRARRRTTWSCNASALSG
eukprot:3488016-Amphidinium_carterae.1